MPKSVLVILLAGMAAVVVVFVLADDVTISDQNLSQLPEQGANRPHVGGVSGGAATSHTAEIAELRREIAELSALVRELAQQQPAPSGAGIAVPENGAPSGGEHAASVYIDQALQAAIDKSILAALKRHDEMKAEEARLKAEADRLEQQELMKGPYGDNNYQVNSLGKQLGLSDAQKNQYHDLLKWQAEEHKKINEWYSEETARGLEQYEGNEHKYYAGDECKRLGEECSKRYTDTTKGFDQGMVRLLTTEQYDKWKNPQGGGSGWKR